MTVLANGLLSESVTETCSIYSPGNFPAAALPEWE